MAVIEIDVQDFLPLGQGDVHNPTAYNLDQWLSLSQDARTQILLESVSHLFSPMQAVAFQQTIINLSVIDSFIMYQQGAKNAGTESPISIFFMWHEARLIEYEQLVHLLNLTDLASVVAAKAAMSTFTMTQEAVYRGVWSRTLAQTFSPASRATSYLPSGKYSSNIAIPTMTGPNAPEC